MKVSFDSRLRGTRHSSNKMVTTYEQGTDKTTRVQIWSNVRPRKNGQTGFASFAQKTFVRTTFTLQQTTLEQKFLQGILKGEVTLYHRPPV